MSEEEKKAIEDLNSFKSISILYGNTFTMFLDQLKKYQQATDIVLNLVQNLQRENNLLNNYVKENETYKKNLFNYAEKKDKQIDLMAKFINKVWCDYPGSIFKKLKDDGFNTNECSNCVGKVCENCIKQYFERKVEDVKD